MIFICNLPSYPISKLQGVVHRLTLLPIPPRPTSLRTVLTINNHLLIFSLLQIPPLFFSGCIASVFFGFITSSEIQLKKLPRQSLRERERVKESEGHYGYFINHWSQFMSALKLYTS